MIDPVSRTLAWGSASFSTSRGGFAATKPMSGPTEGFVDELAARVGRARRSLDRVLDIAGSGLQGGAGRVIAESGAPLGLSQVLTSTTLRSTAEVNATPTSFSPRGPSFNGASTALATVGGTYDGGHGDTTLTFRSLSDETVGQGASLFWVSGSGFSQLINVAQVDTPVTLANGLTVSLSAGNATFWDSFEVDVSARVGSAVDPDKAFDGARNDNPNFEEGLSVTAGSFEVNGVIIDVDADDTLNGVLAKIDASAAGVSANFDAATETVVLTHKTAGSGQTIVVGNDSSGFLAATKLAGATQVLGTDDDPDRPLAEVAALSGVRSGTFNVNGVEFSVDPAVDSLRDVLGRIDATLGDVTAVYDETSDRVVITANNRARGLELSDGTSGLFAALSINDGRYASRGARGLRQIEALLPALTDFGLDLKALFAGELSGSLGTREGLAARLLGNVREQILETFDEGWSGSRVSNEIYRSEHGISFLFRDGVPRMIELEHDRFRRALRSDFDDVDAALFRPAANGQEGGLLVSIAEVLAEAEEGLKRTLSPSSTGQLVNLFA